MMRDSKGKFAKKNDKGLKLELTIPSIKKIIFLDSITLDTYALDFNNIKISNFKEDIQYF